MLNIFSTVFSIALDLVLDCPEVQEIYILPGCFKYANISWITRITTLKRLVIDERCFVRSNEVDGKGICSLADWKSIEEIEIRYRCFMYYKSLEWSNMDNLKKISFGNQCFKNCKVFELSNLESLQELTIGRDCFGDSDFTLRGMYIDGNCRNDWLFVDKTNHD